MPNADKRVAFRAVWLLEKVLLRRLLLDVAVVHYIISRITEVTHPSCQRHYAKIVMHLTSNKVPAHIQGELLDVNTDLLVEQCFKWIIDSKVLVAVKVHACEALFNLRNRHKWIADELSEQLHYLMRNGSAGMQAKGKKLLSLMAKGTK